MDIQEEKADFEADFRKTDFYKMNLVNCFCFINDRYVWDEVQAAWEMWQAAKAQAVPEGFVLVPKDQYESLNEFKGLYKRAIINARKRKDQLNWAHVAGLGVGSGRAVELCKMLNIDPSATNMHEVIEAQEPAND